MWCSVFLFAVMEETPSNTCMASFVDSFDAIVREAAEAADSECAWNARYRRLQKHTLEFRDIIALSVGRDVGPFTTIVSTGTPIQDSVHYALLYELNEATYRWIQAAK